MSGLFGGVKEKILNKVVQIDVEEIVPNPHQPRRCFDDNELEFLAESIKQNGILQPLTVRRNGNTYELISASGVCVRQKLRGFLQFRVLLLTLRSVILRFLRLSRIFKDRI